MFLRIQDIQKATKIALDPNGKGEARIAEAKHIDMGAGDKVDFSLRVAAVVKAEVQEGNGEEWVLYIPDMVEPEPEAVG